VVSLCCLVIDSVLSHLKDINIIRERVWVFLPLDWTSVSFDKNVVEILSFDGIVMLLWKTFCGWMINFVQRGEFFSTWQVISEPRIDILWYFLLYHLMWISSPPTALPEISSIFAAILLFHQLFTSWSSLVEFATLPIGRLIRGIWNRHCRPFADSTRQSLGSGGYVYRKQIRIWGSFTLYIWCLKFDLGPKSKPLKIFSVNMYRQKFTQIQ
jgi:hypothetical protein